MTAVYPADELDAEVDKVIATLVRGPVVALAKTKEAINATTLTELEGALEREHSGQAALLRGTDYREGIKAFQERRAANFTDSVRRLRANQRRSRWTNRWTRQSGRRPSTA